MLEKGKVGSLTIVELDKRICAFWKLTLKDPDWLIDAIREFVPTKKNLVIGLNSKTKGYRKLGFQTLLMNRTSRAGVIAGRAGILNRGERNRGPFSRWYPETLIKRIQRIKALRSKITFIAGDGLRLLYSRRNRKNDIYFIDPPYSLSQNGAGRRLYSHFDIPHEELLKALRHLAGRYLVTYDANRTVEELAKSHKLTIKRIPMKNSHHTTKTELLISDNLDWVSRHPKTGYRKSNTLPNDREAKLARKAGRL
jgi:DNA adenine methylase